MDQQRVSRSYEPTTLQNIAEGSLEQQFQDHLTELTRIFEKLDVGQSPPWELNGNKATATVTLKAKFTHDYANQMTFVEVHSELTPPKRKGVSRAVLIRGDVILTEPAGEQLDIVSHINANADRGEP